MTSNGVTTLTVADNGTPLADLDTTGAVQKLYLSGPAVDELLASVDAGGSVAWYLSDVRGSIRQVLDSGGIEQDRISYDPFGIITSETNAAVGGKFKYTGREFDPVTNLQYNRARYYDALSGRFLSEDPSGLASGDPNFYRYVGNSPTNATDPSGLKPQKYGDAPAPFMVPAQPLNTSGGPEEDLLNRLQEGGTLKAGSLAQPVIHQESEALKEEVSAFATRQFVRLEGTVQVAGGGSQAVLAGVLLATPEPFVSKAIGVALLVWLAYDNIHTGVQKVESGVPGDSLTTTGASRVLQSRGYNESESLPIARSLDGLLNLVTSWRYTRVTAPKAASQTGGVRSTKPLTDKLGGADKVPESVSHPSGHGFSLRAINPGQYKQNCAECAVLTDDLLAGRAFNVARDIGLTNMRQLERALGGEFTHNLTAQQIQSMLSEAGPGSRSVIYAHRGDPTNGHFFNAVNQRGVIRFLNGQAGTAQDVTGFVNGEMSILWTKP